MGFRTATFTSVQDRRLSGYQLVNVSDGINDHVARHLSKWSPSHDGLADSSLTTHSFNFFRCDDDEYGFSRTCFGGPEYSGRSGLQVFTQILVLSEREFFEYSFDAAHIIGLMASSGAFHFDMIDSDPLDPRLLRPSMLHQSRGPDDIIGHYGLRAVQMLARDQQLAVVGVKEKIPFLATVFENLDQHVRKDLSFCTGLRPTKTRPFKVQMFDQLGETIKNELNRDRIPILDCRQN